MQESRLSVIIYYGISIINLKHMRNRRNCRRTLQKLWSANSLVLDLISFHHHHSVLTKSDQLMISVDDTIKRVED